MLSWCRTLFCAAQAAAAEDALKGRDQAADAEEDDGNAVAGALPAHQAAAASSAFWLFERQAAGSSTAFACRLCTDGAHTTHHPALTVHTWHYCPPRSQPVLPSPSLPCPAAPWREHTGLCVAPLPC